MDPRKSSRILLALGWLMFGTAVVAKPAPKTATAKICRSIKLPDGDSTKMCKGSDGRWLQAEDDSSTVPDKAEITYRGTWSGTSTQVSRSKPRINLGGGLDFHRMLNSAVNSATSAVNSAVNTPAAAGVHKEGAMTLIAKFDGPSLTMTSTGTGGWKAGVWTGVYAAGRCHVVSSDGAEVMDGTCDRNGFAGESKDSGSTRVHYAGQFESNATAFVDVAARDAKRDALQRQCDAGKTQACVALDQK